MSIAIGEKLISLLPKIKTLMPNIMSVFILTVTAESTRED